MYKLGRFLQVVAMCILPVAMAGQMLERITVQEMMLLLALGVGVFFVGWTIQQSGRPP